MLSFSYLFEASKDKDYDANASTIESLKNPNPAKDSNKQINKMQSNRSIKTSMEDGKNLYTNKNTKLPS